MNWTYTSAMDITQAEFSRAVRWIQEKLVFFSLWIAIFAVFVSAISVTWSVTRTIHMTETIHRQNTEIEQLRGEWQLTQVYVNKLSAELEARGITVEK